MHQSATHVRELRMFCACAAAAVVLLCGGCSSSQESTSTRLRADGAAARPGLVLPVAPLEEATLAHVIAPAPRTIAGASHAFTPAFTPAPGWEYARNDASLALRSPHRRWDHVAIELEVHDAQRTINGRPRNFYHQSIHIHQFKSD